jgi:flagellin
MAMQINTNILSMTAQRNVGMNESRLGTAIERLSTGLRINSARDDAAGMAISERFTSQIRGQTVAQRNANDAISLSQTAEGALGVLGDALQRMRELTVQSLNGMNTVGDRAALQQEIVQLREEIERIAQDTTFNGKNLLNGSLGTMNFQIGSERGDVLGISGLDARASQLGTNAFLDGTQGAVDFGNVTGDITINGVDIDVSGADSMAKVAEAINGASFPKDGEVTAGLGDAVQSFTYANDPAGSIDINGTTVPLANLSIDQAVNAINNAGIAGVSARVDDAGLLEITSKDGDLVLENEGGGALTLAGPGNDVTYRQPLTLLAEGSLTLSDNAGTPGDFLTELGIDGTSTVGSLDSVSVETVTQGNNALTVIDTAIDQITSLRAELGALQNRFENVVEVISVHRENLEAARSRIRDADFAAETANLTRAQILQQAGISSLAQANSAPQSVLSLLQ